MFSTFRNFAFLYIKVCCAYLSISTIYLAISFVSNITRYFYVLQFFLLCAYTNGNCKAIFIANKFALKSFMFINSY